MKPHFRAVLLALALVPAAAFAADTTPPPEPKKDSKLEDARAAIAARNWSGAQTLLRELVAGEPNNADAHNLYAYSIRKGPNPDMSLVFKHYNQALSLNPKHRGAHEYLGEAYLMVNNVAKAKEHLAQLDRLCTFGCAEYSELKEAIGAFEKKTTASR